MMTYWPSLSLAIGYASLRLPQPPRAHSAAGGLDHRLVVVGQRHHLLVGEPRIGDEVQSGSIHFMSPEAAAARTAVPFDPSW
jgi:hypothetical protein